MRNRVTAASCALVAVGLAVDGCSSSGHSSASAVATVKSTADLAACLNTFLGMSLGHRSGTTTVTQAMNLTNNGTTACVLDGYPGVNLIGVAHGHNGYTWTLQWATVAHSPVTLEPGATAHFDVVYVPEGSASMSTTASASASPSPSAKVTASGKATAKPTTSKTAAVKSAPVGIEVLDITITLPNTYTQDRMAWYAQILLQDNVAHAQTYVTPFVAGAA